jgi:hypothetical protein
MRRSGAATLRYAIPPPGRPSAGAQERSIAGMKSDFYTAIAQIAAERGIPKEAVLSSVEHALKSVYKKMANTEEEVAVDVDQTTGAMRIFAVKAVVDEVEDPLSEMSLAASSGRRRTSAASPRRP